MTLIVEPEAKPLMVPLHTTFVKVTLSVLTEPCDVELNVAVKVAESPPL